VVKTLLDPNLLPKSGMFSGIAISAPKGNLLNPAETAAVGARSITCNESSVHGSFGLRNGFVLHDANAGHAP
jgi:N-methylhydantoinase B/oxoprolinase/acetone carboxylase alpha subunit